MMFKSRRLNVLNKVIKGLCFYVLCLLVIKGLCFMLVGN